MHPVHIAASKMTTHQAAFTLNAPLSLSGTLMSSRSPLPPAQLIALLGALAAFGPLAIDLYLPALPAIAMRDN